MTDPVRDRGIEAVPVFLAGLTAIISAVTLVVGWILGHDIVTRMEPGFAAMVPTTALSFLALSLALICGWTRDRGRWVPVAYVLVFSVAALVIANLSIWLFASVPGLDAFMLADRLGGDRMAIGTAIGLLLACYCIIALIAPDNPDPDLPIYCAVLCASTALGLVGSHIFTSRELFSVPFFQGMSLPTSFCFALLFTAVMSYPTHRQGTEAFREGR